MTKLLAITTAVFAASSVFLFLMWQLSEEKNKKTKVELENVKNDLKTALEQVNALKGTIDVMNKNRKEADVKIEALNNGDSTANALDELCKH